MIDLYVRFHSNKKETALHEIAVQTSVVLAHYIKFSEGTKSMKPNKTEMQAKWQLLEIQNVMILNML